MSSIIQLFNITHGSALTSRLSWKLFSGNFKHHLMMKMREKIFEYSQVCALQFILLNGKLRVRHGESFMRFIIEIIFLWLQIAKLRTLICYSKSSLNCLKAFIEDKFDRLHCKTHWGYKWLYFSLGLVSFFCS